ncbi:hypothetical protein PG994_014214 [Apiospora phragmitis]|uniref:Uncharacterized protein n=1 Tax=Apiospora phragmitis TaxID=2905665 RepID=A0ABR1T3P3_9PEZI
MSGADPGVTSDERQLRRGRDGNSSETACGARPACAKPVTERWSTQARPASSWSTDIRSWRDFHERKHKPAETSWLSTPPASPSRHGKRDLSCSEKEAPTVEKGGYTGKPEPEEPYHVFSRRQKWLWWN